MNAKKEITIRSSAAEYLTFVAATGDNPASIEMRYQDENVWLTQRMMAELYGVEVRTVNEHIGKIRRIISTPSIVFMLGFILEPNTLMLI